MCQQSIDIYDQDSRGYNLGGECYLGEKCQYIFQNTIIGFYGKFVLSDLRQVVDNCFDEEDIDFIELDSKVSKSQGRKQLLQQNQQKNDMISQKIGEDYQIGGYSPIIYISPSSENYDIVLQSTDSSTQKTNSKEDAYYVPNFKSEKLDKIGNQTVQLLSNDIFSQIQYVNNNNNNNYSNKETITMLNDQSSVNNAQNDEENFVDQNIFSSKNNNASNYEQSFQEPLVQAMSADDSLDSNSDSNQQSYQSPKGIKSQQVQSGLWNLDRIDQSSLPLDGRFNFGGPHHSGTGRGVTIYVLDSGIRATHSEFLDLNKTRSRARIGVDFVDNDDQGIDCDGHGTHIASTAVGRAVGIAKEAEVVGVRVLDCVGDGVVGNVVKALEWVAGDRKGPAVVVLSLGVDSGEWSLALEQTVANLIEVHNITVTVASGNMGTDSCSISPANVASTLTVAASNLQNKFEAVQNLYDLENIYQYSNTGACVDIFAPGVDIFGACGGQNKCGFVHDQAYAWDDGTSMAVPHVAGAAAVLLGEFPDASPALIKEVLIRTATFDRITESQLLPNTPNRLLHIDITKMAEQYKQLTTTM